MKPMLFAFAVALGACCSGSAPETADAAQVVCPSDAESSQSPCGVVGQVCATADRKYPYSCTCLCTGKWECDQVFAICDGGAGD